MRALSSLFAFLILALLQSGCRTSASSRCADTICPPGSLCVDDPDIDCVLPDQLAACEGHPDLEECSFVGANQGYCLREICRGIVCGNGLLDPGEACDDGNLEALDSCSPDCNSNYTCGNGVADREVREVCDDGNTTPGDGCGETCLSERCGNQYIDEALGEECDGSEDCGPTCLLEACGNGFIDTPRGEVCDDGNLRSGDGCSSICSNETSSWLAVATLMPDFERINSAMVYEADRDRMLLFGGERPDGTLLGDTWQFDGQLWRRVDMVVAPPARAQHAMAYDSIRGRVVLFGGRDANGTRLNDTWEFDGLRWNQIDTVDAPSPRLSHRMVFDQERGVVFLHGGNKTLQDSWIFDGSNWQVVPPLGSGPPDFTLIVPPPLAKFGLAYDSDRKVVMLFGGLSAGSPRQDQWEFGVVDQITGALGWTEIDPADVIPPPGRSGHSLIYDRNRHEMVMFGGRFADDQLSSETWRFDGSTWSLDTTPVRPTGRQDALAAYDALHHETVVIGGDLNGLSLQLAGADDPFFTWKLAGTSWTSNDLATLVPADRDSMMGSYDTTRNRLLLFGGRVSQAELLQDTWEFDGHQWAPVQPLQSPSARSAGAMAFDELHDQSVLFGGIAEGASLGDTWLFDGQDWAELSVTNGPAPRSRAAMSYDAGRQRIVLFGGVLDGNVETNDTWTFDGQSWSELSPVAGSETPSPRSDAAMSYDPARDRIVLFGGHSLLSNDHQLDDTWEFDGSQWYPIAASQHPPAREGQGLTYVRSTSSVLLHGGFVGGGSSGNATNDTWAYVGNEWTPLASVPTTDAVGHHLFSDSPSGLFVFGGTTRTGERTSVAWKHQFFSFLDPEVCSVAGDEDGDALEDCADPDCDAQLCDINNLTCIANTCQCPTGLTEESNCIDDVDDDCDGLIDCNDTDGCALSVVCGAETDCLDGLDNDVDGLIDCKDPGCSGIGLCQDVESSCSDFFDNDQDGLVDCLDPNCSLNSGC